MLTKAADDPMGPITIEQSAASAATLGYLAVVAGVSLILVASAGVAEMFMPNRQGMGAHAIYAGVLGLGALGYGIGQIKFSKQENRIHFYADAQGIGGLIVPMPDPIPWSAVSNVIGSINDVVIELSDGSVVHIREGLVGKTRGLKGLPSSKKIAQRLENLRARAGEPSAPQSSDRSAEGI